MKERTNTENIMPCKDCKYLFQSDCYPECQKNIQRWNIDLEGACAYAEKKNQKMQNKIIAYLRGLNRINYRTNDELKDMIYSFVECHFYR